MSQILKNSQYYFAEGEKILQDKIWSTWFKLYLYIDLIYKLMIFTGPVIYVFATNEHVVRINKNRPKTTLSLKKYGQRNEQN